MLKIGEFYEANKIAELAGVKGARGLQCGIFVNDNNKTTILIQTISKEGMTENYPNKWDEESIGVLHYCGTNKGQTKDIPKQSLESKLNKHVNEAIFPIHVFVKYPEQYFQYLGEFIRLPKYDETINIDGKDIYLFGLVSKNIELTEMIIRKIMSISHL